MGLYGAGCGVAPIADGCGVGGAFTSTEQSCSL
jgi:hypothetical protein